MAQPKQRRGRQSQPPLKEFGEDPVTGSSVVLKDGRFGPYVTDGKTNASLRKEDSVETITADRAYTLLSERRAKVAAKKPARGKTAKKTPAKKTTAKKSTTKKAPAKKTATKKEAASKDAGSAGAKEE